MEKNPLPNIPLEDILDSGNDCANDGFRGWNLIRAVWEWFYSSRTMVKSKLGAKCKAYSGKDEGACRLGNSTRPPTLDYITVPAISHKRVDGTK